MSKERKPDDAATDAQAAEGADTAQGGDGGAPAAEASQQSPEDQLAELRDKLLRAMADAENTRRRAEKEKQEAAKYGMTKFARDLLSVADNLRRAMGKKDREEMARQREKFKGGAVEKGIDESKAMEIFDKIEKVCITSVR